MTLVYIPVASVDVADRLSRGVYALSQPPGVRPADYISTHAFGWVVHPETGDVRLELDTEQAIPCHVAADPSQLLTIIQDIATEAERAALAAYVASQVGKTVPLSALVPSTAMAEAQTREQLEAAGWFADAQAETLQPNTPKQRKA